MHQGTLISRARAQSFIIKRPRLTKLLDESGARIILLVAPPGYGKTTLAREWLARKQGAVWYAGGPAMADVAALALGLAQALAAGAEQHPKAAERVQILASRDQPPRVLAKAVARVVADECEIVAIDDYHHAGESPDCEAFLAELLSLTHFRLVLTSRSRPAWITPRMAIYGEALVLETVDLAFTDAEAQEVLRETGDRSRERILAQARGWPAVIGLAAMRRGAVDPAAGLKADDLYDFFAEDLFQRASPALRHALFLLALGADVDDGVAKELLGPDHAELMAEAAERGFVSRESPAGDNDTMHPLLKSFLVAKLREVEAGDVAAMVASVVAAAARRSHWDACLAALQHFPQAELIGSTLQQALGELLAAGRVATVKRWIKLAGATGCSDPTLLLAEAEVALREGDDR
ncbi:MAG: hypothetical protein V7644_1268, partial [Actinomycetota bacterium]